MSVTVRAPATVANLGPGFDCLGLALDWWDEILVEEHDGPFETWVIEPGEQPRRFTSRGLPRAFEAVLRELPRARVHRRANVAHGRGFGASAIGVVGGLLAARAFGDTAHTDEEILRLAIELEGHPDNVAPCLLGGITVCAGDQILRLDPPEGLRVLTCVAPDRLPTSEARKAVPNVVAREEVVLTLQRSALLAAALATGRSEHLLEATEDVFHQPSRFELMPETGELVRRLRARGIPAFLSGAGPSVAAFVTDPASEEAAGALAPQRWQVTVRSLARSGASLD